MYAYASELRKFFAFLHSKTAISVNVLSVLQILCRYKWHACRLTCTDKFPNVPTKLRKCNIGGGQLHPPPATPPPSPLATLMVAGKLELVHIYVLSSCDINSCEVWSVDALKWQKGACCLFAPFEQLSRHKSRQLISRHKSHQIILWYYKVCHDNSNTRFNRNLHEQRV